MVYMFLCSDFEDDLLYDVTSVGVEAIKWQILSKMTRDHELLLEISQS